MPNAKDIENNSQLESIQLFVNDLKESNDSQFDSYITRIKVDLSGNKKAAVEAIIQEIIRYCEHQMFLNDSYAIYLLGYINHIGLGVPVDFVKAIRFYNRAIELGEPHAMNKRAFMHEWGQGGPVNLPAAINLYNSAIALGDANAMFNLAYMHEEGIGEDQDNIKAVRLYRRAMEKSHQEAELSLQTQRKVIYQYHYAMGKNDIDTVIDLLNKSYKCVKEFVEFDCENLLDNSNNFERIKSILHQGAVKLEQSKQNELYCSFLMALDDFEQTNEIIFDELTLLKADYLDKLSVRDIQHEKVHVIMQLVIDTWYRIDGFTENAARILSQSMHKIKLEDSDSLEQDILKNIAVILVKNMYGENYSTNLTNLSVQQIMILVAFNEGPSKPSVENMNSILEVELIFNQDILFPYHRFNIIPEENLTLSSTGYSIFDVKDNCDSSEHLRLKCKL